MATMALGLLPQLGGYAGFFGGVVLLDPNDPAVPQLVKGGELELDPGAAPAPDTPLPARN